MPVAGAGGFGGTMVRMLETVAQTDSESQTLIVKAVVPEAVGLPVIAPVLELIVKPAGSVPTEMLHV